jgi:hypothetical protein
MPSGETMARSTRNGLEHRPDTRPDRHPGRRLVFAAGQEDESTAPPRIFEDVKAV